MFRSVIVVLLLLIVVDPSSAGGYFNRDFANFTMATVCFVNNGTITFLEAAYGYPASGPAVLSYDVLIGSQRYTKTLAGPARDGIALHDSVILVQYACSTEWDGYPPACLGILDTANGKLLSTFAVNLQGSSSLVIASDGSLLFSNTDAEQDVIVMSFSTANDVLKLRWNSSFGINRRRAHPTVAGVASYVVFGDGFVNGINLGTGKVVWSWRSPGIDLALAQSDSAFYVLSFTLKQQYFLSAVDSGSGKTLFQVPAPSVPISIANSTFGRCGPAQVVGGVVAFFCYDGTKNTTISAFDTTSGAARFQMEVACDFQGASGYNTLIGNTSIFAASCDNQSLNIHALDLIAGKLVWNVTLPNVDFGFFGSAPTVTTYKSTLVIATGSRLYQLKLSDGSFVSSSDSYADSQDEHASYLCSEPSNGLAYLTRNSFWTNNVVGSVTIVPIKDE
jgi:hypothetical protein